jgi:hypothetical protein
VEALAKKRLLARVQQVRHLAVNAVQVVVHCERSARQLAMQEGLYKEAIAKAQSAMALIEAVE